MVTKYQKFGDGYKAEAVKLYRESNQTIAETARNLGLKESTLANWVKKDKDNEAVAVGEAPTPAPLGVSILSRRLGSGVPCVLRCPFDWCGRAWRQPACRGGSDARFHGPRAEISSFRPQ